LVSKPAVNGRSEREALGALEGAVGRALDELARATARAEAAEARCTELGKLMKRFTGDEGEAGRLLTRLQRLEEENADLRSRVERGRAGVDRLLAKVRFLENQR
jgi:predicted nuclease with TOPRIM domain